MREYVRLKFQHICKTYLEDETLILLITDVWKVVCTNKLVVLYQLKRLGRNADPSPLLVLRFKKQGRATPILSLRTFVACKKSEN
jgi:hypothetical protein